MPFQYYKSFNLDVKVKIKVMKFIALATHLKIVAKLYQQCAILSESLDAFKNKQKKERKSLTGSQMIEEQDAQSEGGKSIRSKSKNDNDNKPRESDQFRLEIENDFQSTKSSKQSKSQSRKIKAKQNQLGKQTNEIQIEIEKKIQKRGKIQKDSIKCHHCKKMFETKKQLDLHLNKLKERNQEQNIKTRCSYLQQEQEGDLEGIVIEL